MTASVQRARVVWGLLLHWYQPPTQRPEVLKRVAEESYRPLLSVLEARPHVRISCNIAGCLLEQLAECGHQDVLDRIARLVRAGQIDLTGSAGYHAILPLIPAAERKRQIQRQIDLMRRHLGLTEPPPGFFPPELAVSSDLVHDLANAGVSWMLAPGIASADGWPVQHVAQARGGRRRLSVLFRDDVRSDRISFRQTTAAEFVQDLAAFGDGRRCYVVVAMDAETFGHHLRSWERQFLASAFDLIAGRDDIAVGSLTDITALFPTVNAPTPRAASWSTTHEDLSRYAPFPLWREPGNRMHDLLWQHVDILVSALEIAERSVNSDAARDEWSEARHLADAALHSCQFWWASMRPHWSPSMVYRGLCLQRQALMHAVRAVRVSQVTTETRHRIDNLLAAGERTGERLVEELARG